MNKLHAPLRDYLIAALLSAGLVAAGLTLYLDNRIGNTPSPITLENQPFRFAMGGGNISSQQIDIKRFSNGLAIISSGNLTLHAEQLSILKIDIDSLDKLEEIVFFARPKHNPSQFIRIPLAPGSAVLLDLRQYPDWQGTISEIGFLARSRLDGDHRIKAFSLEPATLSNEWQSLISSWLQFEPWQQRSVNYSTGGAREQLLYLPSVIIGWFLLAFVVYGLITLFQKRRFSLATPLALVLTGWLILDGRWLLNAFEQAKHSYSSYAGMSATERLKQGIDREIMTYIEHLKKNVLPDTPSKILLLTDSDSSQYFELKARYHLLPHSAYVSSGFPRKDELWERAYILILNINSSFVFNENKLISMQPNGKSRRIRLVHKNKTGNLLQIQ